MAGIDLGRPKAQIPHFGIVFNMRVLAYEHGDIDIFETLKDAELYLEPIDIKNQEYEIFYENGFRINGTVVNDRTKLDSVESQCEREYLTLLIKKFVVDGKYRQAAEIEFLQLESLVDLLHSIIGTTH